MLKSIVTMSFDCNGRMPVSSFYRLIIGRTPSVYDVLCIHESTLWLSLELLLGSINMWSVLCIANLKPPGVCALNGWACVMRIFFTQQIWCVFLLRREPSPAVAWHQSSGFLSHKLPLWHDPYVTCPYVTCSLCDRKTDRQTAKQKLHRHHTYSLGQC